MTFRGMVQGMGAVAIEDAYEKWAAELACYATMLVGPDDAADVVADAFTALLARPDRWHAISDHRPYLFRVVLNAARMRSRSRRRREAREWRNVRNEPTGELVGDPGVVAAVRGLSMQQRAVTYLAYWEDLDIASVAALLGVSDGTVRRQLARARTKLKEALL